MVNLRVWCQTGYTTLALRQFETRRSILLLWGRIITPTIRHRLQRPPPAW